MQYYAVVVSERSPAAQWHRDSSHGGWWKVFGSPRIEIRSASELLEWAKQGLQKPAKFRTLPFTHVATSALQIKYRKFLRLSDHFM